MLQTLIDEITNDPLTKGYAGMTDQEVVDSLNASNRSLPTPPVNGGQLMENIDSSEFASLTPSNVSNLQILVTAAQGGLDLNNANVFQDIEDIFSPGSASHNSISALKSFSGSRAQELKLPKVKLGHVEEAR